MKLGIISDAHHYYNTEGKLCTLSLLARQFEQWAAIFDQVIICAPLLPGLPPSMISPYSVSNIKLLPVQNAGGNSLIAKFDLIKTGFGWLRTIKSLLQTVDAVHIRCPNNISVPGLLALRKSSLLKHAVYTGSWTGHPNEPMTYRAQRMYLKYCFDGPVAVYGDWPNQPSHIVSSFSPSYSKFNWEQESTRVAEKVRKISSEISGEQSINILTIGSLNKNKNQSLVLKSIKGIIETGLTCHLTVIGDGPERGYLENLSHTSGLINHVTFIGNVSQEVVREYYRKADFVIQAPHSEGFGKVPIEAMFHGVIPILSDVDMSQQIVGNGLRGECFTQGDMDTIVKTITRLANTPGKRIEMISNGREYARTLTLEEWQKHLIDTINHYWKLNLSVKDHRA